MDIGTVLQAVVTVVIIPLAVKVGSLDRQVGQLQLHIEYMLKELKGIHDEYRSNR